MPSSPSSPMRRAKSRPRVKGGGPLQRRSTSSDSCSPNRENTSRKFDLHKSHNPLKIQNLGSIRISGHDAIYFQASKTPLTNYITLIVPAILSTTPVTTLFASPIRHPEYARNESSSQLCIERAHHSSYEHRREIPAIPLSMEAPFFLAITFCQESALAGVTPSACFSIARLKTILSESRALFIESSLTDPPGPRKHADNRSRGLP